MVMIFHVSVPTDYLLHSATIYFILFGPSANNYNWITKSFKSQSLFPINKSVLPTYLCILQAI